ncbi:MAG: hypothetical protein ACK4TL_13065 [Hyphomicrobiaceae bacterium]
MNELEQLADYHEAQATGHEQAAAEAEQVHLSRIAELHIEARDAHRQIANWARSMAKSL